MPIQMKPKTEAGAGTKKVRMEGFLTEEEEGGKFDEFFLISAYLPDSVNDDARKKATTTIQGSNGRVPKEEYSPATYITEMIRAQLKDFRLIAPPRPEDMSEKEYEERTETHKDTGDLRWWKFTAINVADLPRDARNFLLGEIVECGGAIATRNLLVTTARGIELDFQKTNVGMGVRGVN